MRGEYILYPGTNKEIIVPNLIPDEGEEAFIKMIFQNDTTVVAGGGNFYVGLCTDSFNETLTLSDLTEPDGTGSYARQTLTRNASGWPTISKINDSYVAVSALITFQPVTDPYNISVNRMFIASSNDSSGKLLSLAGAFPAALAVTVAAPLTAYYRAYLY